MNWHVETALVLAPHTDDGELGCGGAIARLVEAGAAVHYVAFSICEESVPPGFPADVLATEARRATAVLGIAPERLTIHRFPVRHFSSHRQEFLDVMVGLQQKLLPDLVLLPAAEDVHQDHQVIHREGLRAFKHTTLLGYELPWNNLAFGATALLSLEEQHLDLKIAAIQEYQSQLHRDYASADLIRSLALVRGRQARSAYAEAFQVIRWTIR